MFLTRLVYASTVSDGFNPDSIEQILASARRNNGKCNVTGMLLQQVFFAVSRGDAHPGEPHAPQYTQ